jgi:hypothetical protein
MTPNRPAAIRVAVLAAMTACGSENRAAPQASPMVREAGTQGVAPVLDGGTANTVPCNIHTGFPGDDMCILPPDPKVGGQLHYGPADYTNAQEVKNYTLAPGDEITDCVYVPLSNDKPVLVNEFHSRMRPGSHHFIQFNQTQLVKETGPMDAPDPTCGQVAWANSSFVIGSQQPVLDSVGDDDGAPENARGAQQIAPHLQAILQYHFINTTAKPILREGWLNYVYADPAKVKQLFGEIFFLAGYRMDVPIGTSATIHGTATVPPGAGQGFRVTNLTPHSHTHTTRWRVYATIGGVQSLVLETFPELHVLSDPTVMRYDSVTKNPVANETNHVAGGYSGILAMQPGDTFDWYCDVVNDDVPGGITFANSVYSGEMCNLFGFYAPAVTTSASGSEWYSANQ